ncbi:MAG: pseudouridine synthase [Methanosphaera sp. rholeuAM74]|nr:MAG: pseudouridine synthase [Methanosphaera sp. rholeuAM74]
MNNSRIPCITELSLKRPEVVRWQERMGLLEPFSDTVVVLPCSMKKPYSQSQSHTLFKKYTKGLQEVIVTSPFGICPREMERTYPIQSYDASTTGDWSNEEIISSAMCLKEYVEDRHVIAHVSGGYRDVCEFALDDVVYTCIDGNTRSDDSLNNLKNEVRSADKPRGVNRKLHELRSIARYQFNTELGDLFIPDNTRTSGRFNTRVLVDKEQIATLHFETGLYTLNLAGGKFLMENEINRVFIDFDLKSNTLFAPGIVDADEDICPNDEVVVVRDDCVVGVGKSMMNGEELVKADMGVGVKIRHQIKN